MRLNKFKCKVLQLGQTQLQSEKTTHLDLKKTAKKDLGNLVNKKLESSVQSVLAAQKDNSILGQKEMWPAGTGRTSSPSLCPSEAPSGVLHPGLKPLKVQEGYRAVVASTQESRRMIRGVE